MALTHTGATYGWGASEQSQLGRRTVERTKTGALVPREFGLPSKGKNRIAYVSCGSYHSFAIDTNNKVWSWGLNNFAETGIVEGAGEDEAFVNKPTIVESLSEYTIKEIKGGGHHSIACTDDGKLLTWGRIDGHQVGIDIADLPDEDIIKDTRNEPRILKVPTVIPGRSQIFLVHLLQVLIPSQISMPYTLLLLLTHPLLSTRMARPTAGVSQLTIRPVKVLSKTLRNLLLLTILPFVTKSSTRLGLVDNLLSLPRSQLQWPMALLRSC